MKITPGPWKLAEILEGDYNPDSELPDDRPVTHCVVAAYDENLIITYGLPATDRSDEFMANASLIAAAPELLEVCQESLKWFGKLAADHDGDYIAEVVMKHFAKVEAVIAKAEGGS